LTFSPGTYTIEVGVIDPLTKAPGISFANKATEENGKIYRVMEFTIH